MASGSVIDSWRTKALASCDFRMVPLPGPGTSSAAKNINKYEKVGDFITGSVNNREGI